MILINFLLAAIIGYLLGAIPFGLIYVRLIKGIDLREVGSGRTGGTNSLRAAGWQVGVMTGVSDALKGATAVWVTTALFATSLGVDLLPWAQITAGIFAVIGHNWSIYINFGGGAGTGPNVGWAMGVWLPMFPIAIVVMVGMLVGVGMASVASIAMAVIIPVVFAILYWLKAEPIALPHIVGGIITTAIVVWALRPNIKRIMEGTERVVGPRAKRMENNKAAEKS